MPPDLVIHGNLLVDEMVFPDGRTRMAEPGGASLWGLTAGVRCPDYRLTAPNPPSTRWAAGAREGARVRDGRSRRRDSAAFSIAPRE